MSNVKLYFMCGLPTETEEDVLGMAAIAIRIREEVMLPWARRRGRMGRISLSVNPFVPKPWTPFQWAPLAPRAALEAARRLLERTLRPKGIDVESLSAREAHAPGAPLARRPPLRGPARARAPEAGGRPAGRAAALAARPRASSCTARSGLEERLPWDFLDHGLTKAFLAREYRRGTGAKLTPKCAVATCRACGLDCAEHPELAAGTPAP